MSSNRIANSPRWFGLSLLSFLAVIAACEPTTSSSSNWLRCERTADCPSADGVRCGDGYCVDGNGNRMRKDESSTGGATSVPGAGGAASPSGGSFASSGTGNSVSGGQGGGGDSVGGTSSDHGGSPQAGTAGGPSSNAGAAGACSVTREFLASLKSCTTDADCTKTRYQVNCCGTNAWVAVRADRIDELNVCLSARPAFPACGCASAGDTVEDGRFVHYDGSDVAARCVDGLCQSRVSGRSCGPTNPVTCAEGQLCVAYESVIGPTATVDYACVANPCSDAFSCTCAQPSCDLRTDTTRSCSLAYGFGGSEFLDIVCQDNRQ